MSLEERTLEQVYRSAVSGLYARLRSNYDFLYRRFGDDGIKLIDKFFGGNIFANFGACLKNQAFGFQNLQATVDYFLVQFEIRNTIAQQTSNGIVLLKQNNGVTGSVQ